MLALISVRVRNKYKKNRFSLKIAKEMCTYRAYDVLAELFKAVVFYVDERTMEFANETKEWLNKSRLQYRTENQIPI